MGAHSMTLVDSPDGPGEPTELVRGISIMTTLSERVDAALKAVEQANNALRGETTPQEKLALVKVAHETLGNSLALMEKHQAGQVWANVKVRDLTLVQKSRMVAAVGYEEFRRRLEAEY